MSECMLQLQSAKGGLMRFGKKKQGECGETMSRLVLSNKNVAAKSIEMIFDPIG